MSAVPDAVSFESAKGEATVPDSVDVLTGKFCGPPATAEIASSWHPLSPSVASVAGKEANTGRRKAEILVDGPARQE